MPLKKQNAIIRDQTDLYQRENSAVVKTIARTAIIDGVQLNNVAVGTATTKVSHGLGRIPKGFIVVDLTVDSRIFRDPAQTNERHLFLHLKATTATTVSLWVY